MNKIPIFRISLDFHPLSLKISALCLYYQKAKEEFYMTVQALTQYFTQYGAIFVFLIVLLEYMNLPGFPAGVIMPLAGIWAARGEISFQLVLALSVAAGLTGSWILYFLGRLGGEAFLRFYIRKFPKHKELIEKNVDTLRRKGAIGVFIAKLVPMVRTLISIPAGMISMEFGRYTVSSALGVFVWNLVFVGAGYFLGDTVWSLFA